MAPRFQQERAMMTTTAGQQAAARLTGQQRSAVDRVVAIGRVAAA
jgi:hypothetical protein